jgi:hypothetical protein
MEDKLNFLKMEDDIKFLTVEDHLNFLKMEDNFDYLWKMMMTTQKILKIQLQQVAQVSTGNLTTQQQNNL